MGDRKNDHRKKSNVFDADEGFVWGDKTLPKASSDELKTKLFKSASKTLQTRGESVITRKPNTDYPVAIDAIDDRPKPKILKVNGLPFRKFPESKPADDKLCVILLKDGTVTQGTRFKPADTNRMWKINGEVYNDNPIDGWWYK